MYSNNIYMVANAIKNNPKRMAKLNGIPRFYDKVNKAKGYVVAECQAQKIRLNEDDIRMAAVLISEYKGKG